MNAAHELIKDIEQGSPAWLALRKTKITATDSCIIMGASHWKTKTQLYYEKLSDETHTYTNERMQRGLDLEPMARDLFNLKVGFDMKPAVIVKDWLMASLDGKDEDSGSILEIKCPGEHDHAIALAGKTPEHYYPQLQHQMYVADVDFMYYFSFDGLDGAIVKVKRDDEYINKMLQECKKFYDCLINKTPPEPETDDYIIREDETWKECASKWMAVNSQIKALEAQEEKLRKQLVFLSGSSNAKGAGIYLCQIQRKGNIQYGDIPELKGVNLDLYRKPQSSNWRITCL